MAGTSVALGIDDGNSAGKKDKEKKNFRPIILPKDGCKSAGQLITELTINLSVSGLKDLVGMIKVNDGNFICNLCSCKLRVNFSV